MPRYLRKKGKLQLSSGSPGGGGDVVNDDHDDMERPIPPPPGLVLRASKPVVATNHSSLPTTCLSAFDF